MKKIRVMLLLAGALLPLAGFADETTNVTWKSNVALGASYKSGNTDQTFFSGDLNGSRYAPESDWINTLHGEYGKTDGEQTEGQVRGQSDYRRKFSNKNFYGGVFVELYHDSIKNIMFRGKLGPNLGYYFINKEKMKLDFSAGVNYVYESSDGDASGDAAEIRLAGNYLWDFTETASYYCKVEYSAKADDLDQNNGLLVTGLKTKINNKFSLYVELRDEYESQVPSDVDHNDFTAIAGLSYDLF